MKFKKIIVCLLLIATLFSVVFVGSSCAKSVLYEGDIQAGDGYQINNHVIDVSDVFPSNEYASFHVYEKYTEVMDKGLNINDTFIFEIENEEVEVQLIDTIDGLIPRAKIAITITDADIINTKGVVDGGHEKADFNDSWDVTLYFTSLSSSSDNNSPPPAPATYDRIFGISSNATDGFDRDIDKPAPPEPQGDALDVYFPCEHDVVTRLASDIKSNDTEEWKLNLEVPSQSTTQMRWNNASIPADEEFTIIVGDSKTDMKSNEMIEFTSGSHEITVHIGDVPDSTPSPDPSGGSSGGGGGGGATGEEFENIASKHAQVNKVAAGEDVRYEFNEDDNAVMAIQFKSLTNEGQTKTSIEILKDTSALVDSPAPGKVYQNLNIWVGNVAFDEEDMDDPVVGFRVSKEWLSDNVVEPDSIVLCRYNDGEWTQLPTEVIGEDKDYFTYESETPGFSPFAITAISQKEESSANTTSGLNESLEEIIKEKTDNKTESKSNETPGFGVLLTCGVLTIIGLLTRKKN